MTKIVQITAVESKYTSIRKVLVFMMMLAPVILGMTINSLGNADIIKYRIVMQLDKGGLLKTLNQMEAIEKLPKWLWRMGFLFPFGGLVGSLQASTLNEKFGRRMSTSIFCASVILAGILKITSFFTHFSLLFIGRFFDGLGAAGLMNSAIVFMFEMTGDKASKFYKPTIQIMINFGIFLMTCFAIKEVFESNYYYLFIFPMVAAAIVGVCAILLPESPVWLYYVKEDEKKAVEALKAVHGDSYQHYFNKLLEMASTKTTKENEISIMQLFTDKHYRYGTISMIVIQMAQQLSGINAIAAFAPTYLETAKVSRPDIYSLIVIGSALLASICFAYIVSTFRRKLSLMAGHGLMGVSLIVCYLVHLLAASPYAQVAMLTLFIVIFQVGPGPIPWFIGFEMYTSDAMSAAQSLGVSANWGSNTIIFAIAGIHPALLGVFAFLNIVFFVYIGLFVEETLHKSSEDILRGFARRFKRFAC